MRKLDPAVVDNKKGQPWGTPGWMWEDRSKDKCGQLGNSTRWEERQRGRTALCYWKNQWRERCEGRERQYHRLRNEGAEQGRRGTENRTVMVTPSLRNEQQEEKQAGFFLLHTTSHHNRVCAGFQLVSLVLHPFMGKQTFSSILSVGYTQC